MMLSLSLRKAPLRSYSEDLDSRTQIARECENEAAEQRKNGERMRRQKDENGNAPRNMTNVPITTEAMSRNSNEKHTVIYENINREQQNIGKTEVDNKLSQDTNDNKTQNMNNVPRITFKRNQSYLAYLLCAYEDLAPYGMSFLREMEGWGLKIFCPERDLLAGGIYYENVIRAIEKCNGKVIVVLTKSYGKSEECQVLTYHALSLDQDSRRRNIIPVIFEDDVELLGVLQGLAIIKYQQASKCNWLKFRLCEALAA